MTGPCWALPEVRLMIFEPSAKVCHELPRFAKISKTVIGI